MKSETKQKMLSKATAFLNIQNQYFAGKISDAEMTEITTQPFWQSMRLSKKRLDEKGLVAETTIAKATSPMRFVSDTSDSRSEIGNFNQPIKEHKKIYAKGRIIYSKKDDKLCIVSAIKANGDGETATCPNCGNTGKISTYIDGCDYCGSKFTVNDFSEKISAYSFEENTSKKVLQAFKVIALIAGISVGIVGLIAALSFILVIALDMTKGLSTTETYATIIFMAAYKFFPLFWKIFICTGFIFICIFIATFNLLRRQVVNSQLVKSRIDKFSPADFAQNLEFKLRNIHFVSDAKEVNVYSNFDLGGIITNYKDVIECTLSKLTFKKVYQRENMYLIDADLICSLTKYRKDKVWLEGEKISVTLSAPKDLQDRPLSSIHCYRCPNCSGTISLLNGGVCEYCGTKLDYSKYSWMLERYASHGKVMNPFTKIKWLLLGVYMALFLILSTITISTNYQTIYQISHFDECIEISNEEFDSVTPMHEVVAGVLPSYETKASTERVRAYYIADSEITVTDAIQAYEEYLSENDFYLKSVSNSSKVYYKPIYYPEIYLAGHFELEIYYNEKTNEIVVEYRIDDSPYED